MARDEDPALKQVLDRLSLVAAWLHEEKGDREALRSEYEILRKKLIALRKALHSVGSSDS